ncbi:MAG: tripartite tricarboxylate transporter substrate binding protein [Pseudomonadota bacterium]
MCRYGLVLLTIAALTGSAQAQNYPSRPVTMVVPFPPGGNTDLMARALQTELSKALGQSVIINNKGGAAGTIGILELVKAEPDGYTIALSPNNPLTAQPHMQQLRYGMDTFRYVCLTYDTPYVLIAGPQAPFKTFPEFLAFAKAKKENLVYGHPGVASQPHLVMLAVLKAAGVDGLGVPFQGAGPMSHALLGGTIMAITESPAVAKASSLPILAAVSDERIAGLPDVPTMKELGYPAKGFSAGGLIVPAKTPDVIVTALEKACASATAAAEYKAIVERLGAIARYLPGDAFRKMFEQDSAVNADAIKSAGLGANR